MKIISHFIARHCFSQNKDLAECCNTTVAYIPNWKSEGAKTYSYPPTFQSGGGSEGWAKLPSLASLFLVDDVDILKGEKLSSMLTSRKTLSLHCRII